MTAPLAIVLSGGGARGAFQVGALEELLVHRGVQAGIFCGVSTGAIQALGGAQDDIAGLRDVWLSLRRNSDVYRKRFLGIVSGLFGADSLYNADPIRAKIVDFADEARLQATGRQLLCGVADLQSGSFRSIRENTPDIGQWIYASCAMPGFFQPMKDSEGTQWVDGGVRNITPLDAALEQNPRGVIVIMASPIRKGPDPRKDYDGLIDIALRATGILTKEVFETDIHHADRINAFLAARIDLAARLTAAGITGREFTAIMEPLDEVMGQFRLAPVHFIAPEQEVAETLEFHPDTIRDGMVKGRFAVDAAWPAIQPLVTA